MEVRYWYDRRTHRLKTNMIKGGQVYAIVACQLGELKRRVSALAGAGWMVERVAQ